MSTAQANRDSHFLLSKWYMDCVSDEGEAFIAYAALCSSGAGAGRYSRAVPVMPVTAHICPPSYLLSAGAA